jgi:hypothetical protein
VPSSLDRVLGFAHATGTPGAGAVEDATLSQALDLYVEGGLRRLAGVEARSRGRSYASLYEAIQDAAIAEETLELSVTDPPASGPAWEFLRPMRRVELFRDGTAQLVPLGGTPLRAIARVLLRESAIRPGAEPGLPLGLAKVAEAFAYLRSGPTVPFRIALLLYLSDERVRYELDLTEDALLKDPRAGRAPGGRKLRRPPRIAWEIDRYIASGALPLGDVRILEVLAETRSASLEELALIFGGESDAIRGSLGRLARRGLVPADPPNGQYRVLLDAFRTPTGASAARPGTDLAEAVDDEGSSSLQKEVSDLVASADASATCPVCGDQLPAGHTGLICSRCAAEVSEDPGDG